MKLERLLQLAGQSEDQIEEAMAKYNEPKADHKKKSFASSDAHAKGHDNPKAAHGEGKKAPHSKYAEPHAGKGPKKEKEVKAPEGKMKVAPKSKYTDNNSTE